MINDNQQQRVTGFNCPICSGLIPVSAFDLLNKQKITCPTCQLELMIDQQQSKHAISLLNNVEQSRERLEQSCTSSL